MRYLIKNSQIVESFWIDAPYDSYQDALDALNDGVSHNCTQCFGEPEKCLCE